jgi:hypothetical protein
MITLLLAGLVSCGFQDAKATQCVEVEGGKVRAVTGADQRFALERKIICARKETGEDMDLEDPAILIFWDKGESRDNAMVDLAGERANGCDQ